MCFYWLWDGPLFIYLVTDKTVSWDWSGCFSICTILAVATATVEMHIYFAFYWDILMLREANWSREICKNCRFFGRWKTSGGHFDSRLGHVNSSASIRGGADCFTVSKLQCASSSFNHSPPLHCLLNKRSGAATSQRDCKAWPCNCLDHFHHKMAGLASYHHFKNIFGCKLLKGKETQHSFAGLLNIYISGIWLWYMQALFNNRVKQNRCLKSENPQPTVVTILPPCSGKQLWMWCSVVSSLLDGS